MVKIVSYSLNSLSKYKRNVVATTIHNEPNTVPMYICLFCVSNHSMPTKTSFDKIFIDGTTK